MSRADVRARLPHLGPDVAALLSQNNPSAVRDIAIRMLNNAQHAILRPRSHTGAPTGGSFHPRDAIVSILSASIVVSPSFAPELHLRRLEAALANDELGVATCDVCILEQRGVVAPQQATRVRSQLADAADRALLAWRGAAERGVVRRDR